MNFFKENFRCEKEDVVGAAGVILILLSLLLLTGLFDR